MSLRRRTALRLVAAGMTTAGSASHGRAHTASTGGDTATTATGHRLDDGYGPLGSVELPGATEAVVSADGTTAYVAVGNGYATVDVGSPATPALLARRRRITIGRDRLAADRGKPFESITDVAVDGDTLAVVNDGTPSGVLVVDVSDPDSPIRRGFYPTDYGIHNCDLADGLAYLTVDYSGGRLDIVDVAGNPERVGAWSLIPRDSTWEALPPVARGVHDVFVRDTTAYLAHWDAGTWAVDVSDPTDLRVLAHVGRSAASVAEAFESRTDTTATLPGNSHYAAVDEAGTLLAVGREASASEAHPDGGPGGIDLYEVSDPTTPRYRATVEPPADPDGVGGRWTTAHNFELRDAVLYSSWYNGGVKRHDVSDPSDPVEETWWADPGSAEFFAARAGTPGESFVASSRGRGDSPARLYTFPDGPGETAWGYGEGVPENRPPTSSPAPGGLGEEILAGVAGLGISGLAGALWRRRREP
ncbi:MAG: LVIVD repeat-containing protein [Haloferacaceae archaeon]